MKKLIIFFLLFVQLGFSTKASATNFQIIDLKCEYLTNPLGIDVQKPRLSWNIISDQRNWSQQAYQLLVAMDSVTLSNSKGNLWNSGRVNSEQSINIEYQGAALSSHQQCWWKVKAWNSKGESSGWSTPQRWKMGVLSQQDWKAKWIASDLQLMEYQKKLKALPDFGMEPESEIWELAPKIREMTKSVDKAPAVYLRKEFQSPKKISSAFVSVSGLGLYELYINGRRISDNYLNPAFSDYQKRVFYNTYDVTNNINMGNNAIGVILGNGWYNLIIPQLLRYYAADYIDPPKLLLELNITYADGSTKTIPSDLTWKFTTDGPIQFNCLLGGETYDANKETPGWDKIGFNDAGWKTALPAIAPEGKLAAQMVYPVVKAGTFAATSIKQKSDTIIIDFGKELTGWCRVDLKGKKGQTITISYPGQGSHILGRYQTFKYVFKGDSEEIYEPRFCYNGFRTVEITGLGYVPKLTDFTAVTVYTKMPVVGDFKCSNEKINELQEILLHTIKNYIVHIPNDPTREKAGWSQDVENAFDVTAYNFDCTSLYSKWQKDFLDIQHENGYVPPVVPSRFDGQTINGPWWGGMIVYQPWKIYQYFADQRILEESYPAMKKYIDYLISISDNNIINWGLGEWLEPWLGPGELRPKKTPVPLTSTIAFYYYSTIVSQTAHILGKTDDENKYKALGEKIKISYNQKFFDDKTGKYALGSQASQLMSLCLGLVPEGKENIVKEVLVQRIKADSMHLSTGFVATPFLLIGLTDLGYPEIAYTIATQNTYPSWFDMVFNHGNTVFKESWDGGMVQMPSLGGAIGSWFYYSLAGIQLDKSAPGFKKIVIKPTTKIDLIWVNASYKSIYGTITSNWKIENGQFSLTTKIPANTTALIYIPAVNEDNVMEGGSIASKADGVKFIKMEEGKAVFEVGSGSYEFTSSGLN